VNYLNVASKSVFDASGKHCAMTLPGIGTVSGMSGTWAKDEAFILQLACPADDHLSL
jgi:hypothetical protein